MVQPKQVINRTLGDDRDLLGSTVKKIVSDNTWVRAVVVRVSLYGRAIQDKCNAGAVVSLLHDWRAALGCVALLLRRTDCRVQQIVQRRPRLEYVNHLE